MAPVDTAACGELSPAFEARAVPLVTVILTVFRRTTYLELAIRSVLAQTFTSFELIITDDAASSATRALCERFAQDPRLRYRANARTLGPALNVAAALREARAPYAAILNDDDLMAPTMLETLMAPLLKDSGLAVAFGEHGFIAADGSALPEVTQATSLFWASAGLRPGPVPAPLTLVLRGVVFLVMGAVFRVNSCQTGWFIPEVGGAYDHWLALRLALSGSRFYFVAQRLFQYRAHPDSQSALLTPEAAEAQVYPYTELLKERLSVNERALAESRLAEHLFVLGRDCLYFGHTADARRAFLRSVRLRFGRNLVCPRSPGLSLARFAQGKPDDSTEASCSGYPLATGSKSLLGLLLTFCPPRSRLALLGCWRRLRAINAPMAGAARNPALRQESCARTMPHG